MLKACYSIRMRAAERNPELGEKHISGGERIGSKSQIEPIVKQLLNKASNHSRGDADFIQITVEKIAPDQIQYMPPLEITTVEATSIEKAHSEARKILTSLGVSEHALNVAFHQLSSNQNLRGAIILNSKTGIRLDDRGQKGVRVSRIDWQDADGDFNERVREALALASKVANSPFTIAELCWSDDPDYVTGYVSNRDIGYVRITPLKREGCESGGRAFFVSDEVELDSYIDYLESVPVLIRRD
ncbi:MULTISPECIES: 6-carboxyhexanoate--CoA ligase [unclassified Lysinibacillus]|uniref:6-carboxyhexanoate--CoA ligase n=1 Tax=unclassified Lysinibacillus TaxID=2636778 RepID=UPI002554E450|nr:MULTISPECIES: 6-carboxyhexanoate--CoA ligase [unclassified Lysinibacillus]MDM5247756.1 6-carboxyhexanoate--CoA ligase [Lysinibacillus sp. G4S2]